MDKMAGERRENNLEDRHLSASKTVGKRMGNLAKTIRRGTGGMTQQ